MKLEYLPEEAQEAVDLFTSLANGALVDPIVDAYQLIKSAGDEEDPIVQGGMENFRKFQTKFNEEALPIIRIALENLQSYQEFASMMKKKTVATASLNSDVGTIKRDNFDPARFL